MIRIETSEMETMPRSQYPDRCFFCKRELFGKLIAIGKDTASAGWPTAPMWTIWRTTGRAAARQRNSESGARCATPAYEE